MTRRGAGRQFGVVGRRRFGARHESGALGRIRACVREVVSPEGVTAQGRILPFSGVLISSFKSKG